MVCGVRTHVEDGEELPSVVDVFRRLVLEQETGMGLEMETLLVPLTKVQYTHYTYNGYNKFSMYIGKWVK